MPSDTLATRRSVQLFDRRVWMLVGLVCLFAVLIMKEVSLPRPVVLSIGVVGLFALLVVGLQSPEVPLYILVAYLPFSRMLVGDFGTGAVALNLTNILTLWVFAAYAMRQAGQGKPLFQGTPLNRAIMFFGFLGAVALVRTSWDYGAWYFWEFLIPLKRWLTPILFYFLAFWVARDRRTLRTITIIIMVATAIVAVMAIRDYSYSSGGRFETARVGGVMEQSNTLAAFFVYYMYLFLGFFLTYTRKPRTWWLLIPFLLCFRGIMVTFSRGGYLAFAAGGLGACWFRHKLLFAAAVAFLAFAVVNPVLLPAGIRYRLGHTVAGHVTATELYEEDLVDVLDRSAATRVEIWRGALQMIREHPWTGVGYGAFPAFITRYTAGTVGSMDAHNSYLLVAAEMGIPTLVVFLVVLLMVCYYTRWLYWHTEDRTIKAIALGFLGGLSGLWVANMFGSRMDAQEAAGYFWILAGLIMRGVMIEREELRIRGTGNGERGTKTGNGARGKREARS